jgi:hypothetical protein
LRVEQQLGALPYILKIVLAHFLTQPVAQLVMELILLDSSSTWPNDLDWIVNLTIMDQKQAIAPDRSPPDALPQTLLAHASPATAV